MRITIEKTEAGYNITNESNAAIDLNYVEALNQVVVFMHAPLPPKEPAIPACLHCGSKDAPMFGKSNSGDNWIVCDDIVKQGCGSISGACNTKEKAIALWAGVNAFIEHNGSSIPAVGNTQNVDLKFKDKSSLVAVVAGQWDWAKVTHYRIHKGA